MPEGPKVVVTTTELPSATGVSINTGTAFVVGRASYGPEEAKVVKGIKEAVEIYGPRAEAESTELYDWLNSFFSLGGQQAYINRVLGAGSKFGEKILETAGLKKALVVEAK